MLGNSRRYFWMDTLCIPVGITSSLMMPALVPSPNSDHEGTRDTNEESFGGPSQEFHGQLQTAASPSERQAKTLQYVRI